MATTTASDLKNQTDIVVRFWTAHPEVKLKDVTLEQLKDDVARFDALRVELEEKEEALTPLRNNRDALADELVEIVVRFRSGIKSYFGGDSSEYELVGGTRASERKRPNRRPAATVDARKAA